MKLHAREALLVTFTFRLELSPLTVCPFTLTEGETIGSGLRDRSHIEEMLRLATAESSGEFSGKEQNISLRKLMMRNLYEVQEFSKRRVEISTC